MSERGAPNAAPESGGSAPNIHRLADERWALAGETASEHIIASAEVWVAVRQ